MLTVGVSSLGKMLTAALERCCIATIDFALRIPLRVDVDVAGAQEPLQVAVRDVRPARTCVLAEPDRRHQCGLLRPLDHLLDRGTRRHQRLQDVSCRIGVRPGPVGRADMRAIQPQAARILQPVGQSEVCVPRGLGPDPQGGLVGADRGQGGRETLRLERGIVGGVGGDVILLHHGGVEGARPARSSAWM